MQTLVAGGAILVRHQWCWQQVMGCMLQSWAGTSQPSVRQMQAA